MKEMSGDSFEFRGINTLDKFGIRCVKIDYLLPKKRARKTQIPHRHGQFDHGAECWEERVLRIECDLLRPLSRAELREVTALLSRKGKLYLWDEPDKFYIAEVYEPSEIFEYPKAIVRIFTIEFVCEPFAYRETTSFEITDGINTNIKYEGTEEAPCRIILENQSGQTINNISIISTYRRN